MIFVPNIPDVQGPSRIFLFPEYLKKKGYYIHIIISLLFMPQFLELMENVVGDEEELLAIRPRLRKILLPRHRCPHHAVGIFLGDGPNIQPVSLPLILQYVVN